MRPTGTAPSHMLTSIIQAFQPTLTLQWGHLVRHALRHLRPLLTHLPLKILVASEAVGPHQSSLSPSMILNIGLLQLPPRSLQADHTTHVLMHLKWKATASLPKSCLLL